MVPIAYCETNFIVASALPHHAYHGGATSLLFEARRGACELRIPLAAFLEAKTPIKEQNNGLTRALTEVKEACMRAHASHCDGDFAGAVEFLERMALNDYLRRPALTVIDQLREDPAIVVLADVPAACARLDELRGKLNFTGKDVVDLYLLAAIVADRANEPRERPTIFFSTNRKEFRQRGQAGAKLGAGFYDDYHLVWRENFELEPAVAEWSGRFRDCRE